jgi:hypothetical protein
MFRLLSLEALYQFSYKTRVSHKDSTLSNINLHTQRKLILTLWVPSKKFNRLKVNNNKSCFFYSPLEGAFYIFIPKICLKRLKLVLGTHDQTPPCLPKLRQNEGAHSVKWNKYQLTINYIFWQPHCDNYTWLRERDTKFNLL